MSIHKFGYKLTNKFESLQKDKVENLKEENCELPIGKSLIAPGSLV